MKGAGDKRKRKVGSGFSTQCRTQKRVREKAFDVGIYNNVAYVARGQSMDKWTERYYLHHICSDRNDKKATLIRKNVKKRQGFCTGN